MSAVSLGWTCRRRSSRFGGKDDEVCLGQAESDEPVGLPDRDVWLEHKREAWEILAARW